MKDRIKQVRKEAGVTQVEFGEIIGVKGNTMTNYENGMRTPSDAVIKAICREYKVNENWLRTGEGEMYIDFSRNDEIANLTLKLLKEEPDSFKNRLVSVLSRMTEDEWELLERKMHEIIGDDNKKE